MTCRRCSLISALGLVVATAPPAAQADDKPWCASEAAAVKTMKRRDPSLASPDSARAKDHVEAGRRAFRAQNYIKATVEYAAARLDDPAPLIVYDLGQTYRAAKQYDTAIPKYQLFLDLGKPGAEVRALVECHIATMKAELDRIAATAQPSEPAAQPADAMPTGPVPEQADATPAEHPGARPAENSVGPPATSDSALPVLRDPDQPTAQSRWTTQRRIALGLGVAGVGAVIAGAVFGFQTKDYQADATRLCPSSRCLDASQVNALSERADRSALLANVSFGVGAGTLVAAAVLWYVGAPSNRSSFSTDHVVVVPQLNADLAGIACAGRF